MVSTDAVPESKTPACSFCGKPEHEVDRMIRGKSAMICTECIESLHQTEILDRQQEQMLDTTDDA
jgi:ATP-dependent Clp protease ATP-binding subunit ClpX